MFETPLSSNEATKEPDSVVDTVVNNSFEIPSRNTIPISIGSAHLHLG